MWSSVVCFPSFKLPSNLVDFNEVVLQCEKHNTTELKRKIVKYSEKEYLEFGVCAAPAHWAQLCSSKQKAASPSRANLHHCGSLRVQQNTSKKKKTRRNSNKLNVDCCL